jgi:hypothetical protein
MPDTPFDSIESAHEYVTLLATQVEEVQRGLADDILAHGDTEASRYLEALHLVAYKMNLLRQQLAASSRVLNDLRTLRRLMFAERTVNSASSK